MTSIKKVLIANRGEIAIRVARTCRKMGIKTVGIFSELDSNSLHLDFCDEVYSLGDGNLSETYLNIPKITDIIKKSKAQAVHPGYGFLSERAAFAKAVEQAQSKFVGPSALSIQAMGDKLEAKRVMQKMGVPMIPGSGGGVQDLKEAEKIADKIGYPVLIKAAAGGGGKGMRVVQNKKDLQNALESAAREAKSSFGDSTVYIEKYLTNPHHVEVQVLGDGHGGGGHVFDRECSVQRRHQKLIEESPAPLLEMHPQSKKKILETASKVVHEMKYSSAGTLEFVADDDGNFYFLEMNTRLQVEHPVTEWVTGLDLVEYQIRVAQGEKFKAEPLAKEQKGHAIEFRVYAETPFDYLPTGGKISGLNLPSGPFVRVDSAAYVGYTVPIDYDPTLLKLSAWGETRKTCIETLRAALLELKILGVESNQALFWCAVHEPKFLKGIYGTSYLNENQEKLKEIYQTSIDELKSKLSIASVELFKTQTSHTKTNEEEMTAWELASRQVSERSWSNS